MEEGSEKDQPDLPTSVPSDGRSRLRSGQDLGLCPSSGAPLRGIPTLPFPRPRCHLLCPWWQRPCSPRVHFSGGRPLWQRSSTRRRRGARRPGGQEAQRVATGPCTAHMQLRRRFRSLVLPGKGALWSVGSLPKGSGFLPLIVQFIPQRELFIESSSLITACSSAFAFFHFQDA